MERKGAQLPILVSLSGIIAIQMGMAHVALEKMPGEEPSLQVLVRREEVVKAFRATKLNGFSQGSSQSCSQLPWIEAGLRESWTHGLMDLEHP